MTFGGGTLQIPFLHSPFTPPRWMKNPHFQTIYTAKMPRRWDYGWKAWEPLYVDLGKAGKLLAEASWQPGERGERPALFLMHGLEGSAQSHYVIGMSRKAYENGFHTIRVNTRNCGGTEQLTPTLYCAGLSEDVHSVVRFLRDQFGIRKVFAAGVSLGANMILKYLGEQGENGPELVQGAAVLSPPIDLGAGVRLMEEPQNRIYQRYFVGKLIERMCRKTALYPEIGNMNRIARIRTIYEFDDVVTAPHFGFGGADNYYRLASSGPLLGRIRVPTLIVQAKDDPLIPFSAFQNPGLRGNPAIRLLTPDHGGHSGFLERRRYGSPDLDGYWGESRAVQFLSELAFAHADPSRS
jgi:uncharacterized protein